MFSILVYLLIVIFSVIIGKHFLSANSIEDMTNKPNDRNKKPNEKFKKYKDNALILSYQNAGNINVLHTRINDIQIQVNKMKEQLSQNQKAISDNISVSSPTIIDATEWMKYNKITILITIVNDCNNNYNINSNK